MEDNKKNNLKSLGIIVILAIILHWIINNLESVSSFLNNIKSIISPFILGGALAFILNIPMSFLERKIFKVKEDDKKIKNKSKNKKIRVISFILSILVIVSIVVLFIRLVVPELVNVFNILIDNIPYYAEELTKVLESFSEEIDTQTLMKDINGNLEGVKTQFLNQIPTLLSSSVSVIGNIIGGITTFIVAFVFAIYILMDKENIGNNFNKILKAYVKPEKIEKILNIGKVSSSTFRSFLTVQCLEATILGVLCIIGMLILKIPYAITIGVLIGVTALIPVVGAFIGCIIGAILIVAVNPTKVITFIIFFLILQQIEGNVIYPRVVGSSIGLPGIWVLVAVSVGGDFGGVLGMFLGVPVATIIYTLLKNDVNKKLEEKECKVNE